MRLDVTSDTGQPGDLAALAHELQDQADAFADRTSAIPGVLGVCLRSLPADAGRRSSTRFDRRDDALDADLTVAQERLAGATLDQQRELVGLELHGLLDRGFASRTAPWTSEQRSVLRAAAVEVLRALGWLDGRRARARTLLSAGSTLADVADSTGLPLGEVEDLYADLVADD